MKFFPTLYQKTQTGAIQRWTISTHPQYSGISTIITIWGQEGGKIQETRDDIREGKNLGKSNATTAVEQAELEAKARWNKKIEREGYVEDLERARAGETDAAGGIAPMLAPTKLQEKNLRFPLDLQAKLDGVRCVVMVENGKVSLWSRRREQMKCLPHIEAAYSRAFGGFSGTHIFDGEAYRHGWALQKIASFVRKKNETRPGFEEITHNVYDMPSAPGTWLDRRIAMSQTLFTAPEIKMVETVTVNSMEEAWAYHDDKVAEGYEGAMARNHHGLYDFDKRSSNLQKLKAFEDHEFEIVGVSEGRGKFAGKAIFTCQIEGDHTFDCAAPGTLKDKERYFRDFESYRGRMLAVKHKGYTAEGKPWHPVGKAVRDYE